LIERKAELILDLISYIMSDVISYLNKQLCSSVFMYIYVRYRFIMNFVIMSLRMCRPMRSPIQKVICLLITECIV